MREREKLEIETEKLEIEREMEREREKLEIERERGKLEEVMGSTTTIGRRIKKNKERQLTSWSALSRRVVSP